MKPSAGELWWIWFVGSLVVILTFIIGCTPVEEKSRQDVHCDWEGGLRESCSVDIGN